jgi:hypothetical protein
MEAKKKVMEIFGIWIIYQMKEKSVPRFSSYAAKRIIYMHGTDTAVLEIASLLF